MTTLPTSPGLVARLGFWVGLGGGVLGCVLATLPLPWSQTFGPDALRALAVAWTMACWWITEAIPIPATSMLPLAAFPLLGVVDVQTTASAYADRFVILLMAGFMVAVSIEAHGLHRRLALGLMARLGTSPGRILASFMAATALLSMWISNTATTLMMLPIAVAVLAGHAGETDAAVPVDDALSESSPEHARYRLAVMLGIAYASNIGGIATPIGTPPNLIMMGVHGAATGHPLTFAQWLAWGLPFVVLFVPIAGLLLYRTARLPRGFRLADAEAVVRLRRELGRMRAPELRVLIVFVLTAVAWITRRGFDLGAVKVPGWQALLGAKSSVDDSTVAVVAALLLFALPAGGDSRGQRLLDWKTARSIPWGLLLLFGGGIALARGFEASGLSSAIGVGLAGLSTLPPVLLVACVALTVTFLTEITSNTATTTLLMPILVTAAAAAGLDPLLLMVPAAMSASCAFMLPVATAPNAIVFGTGAVPIASMARHGFVLNLIGAVLVTAVVMLAI